MTVEHYRVLFEYTAWAHGRVLDRVAELTEAEYTAAADLYHGNGSIRATLVHMLGAEEAWVERCYGREPARVVTETDVPSFAALRACYAGLPSQWSAFCSRLQDSDLDQLVSNTSRSGRVYTNPLWARLSHAVNHGTQHRSDVALALTRLARSPGDLDFLIYYSAAHPNP